jgi:hypothetical protein
MRDSYDMFKQPERSRFGDNEHQSRPGRGPKVTGTSDLIDLRLLLRSERPNSIAVSDPSSTAEKWIWLPKSQIEFEKKAGGLIEIKIPEWLARDKGLV